MSKEKPIDLKSISALREAGVIVGDRSIRLANPIKAVKEGWKEFRSFIERLKNNDAPSASLNAAYKLALTIDERLHYTNLLTAAKERVKAGHNHDCATKARYLPGDCNCGHDKLSVAISEQQ